MQHSYLHIAHKLQRLVHQYLFDWSGIDAPLNDEQGPIVAHCKRTLFAGRTNKDSGKHRALFLIFDILSQHVFGQSSLRKKWEFRSEYHSMAEQIGCTEFQFPMKANRHSKDNGDM